ncbi:MAG: protein kinase [Polyangiales bacterium]
MAATGEPEQTRKYPAGDSNFPARASYKTHGALPEILPVEGQLGPYELVAELGAGGMGNVFVATRQYAGNIKRTVAMKTLKAHLIRRNDLVEMFMNEARIAARISHPYVCTVNDVGIADGVPYVAMDYLVGEPLSRILPLFVESPDELSIACATRLMTHLCEGLHAAHDLRDDAGTPLDVVHRDISPDNLFVLYDGTVRVVDFGIALTSEHQRNGKSKALLGKCAYMSPEQVRTQPLDRRSDIWSMGVVLWELLTGKRLFQRPSDLRAAVAVLEDAIEPPSKLNPIIPSALDRAVLRALERDPTKRYASARDFAKELERVSMRSLGAISASELGLWLEKLFPGSHEVRRSIVAQARDLLKKQETRVSVTGEWLLSRDMESDVAGLLAPKGGAAKLPRTVGRPSVDEISGLATPVVDDDVEANAEDRLDAARRRGTGIGPKLGPVAPPPGVQIANWVRDANVTHTGRQPIVTSGRQLDARPAHDEPPAGEMQEPAPNTTDSAQPASSVSTRVRIEPVWRRVAPVLAIAAAFGGVAVVWAWPKRANDLPMRPPAPVAAMPPSPTQSTTSPSSAPPKLVEQPPPAGVPSEQAPAAALAIEPELPQAEPTPDEPELAPAGDAPREAEAPAQSAKKPATTPRDAREPQQGATRPRVASRADTGAQTGQLYFMTNTPNVTVKFADRVPAKVPAVLTLPAGAHVVQVQRSGGKPVEMKIQVVPGRTGVLQLD